LTRWNKLLDLGQRQFGKFAEAYGANPEDFKKSANFKFSSKTGQVLLEGTVVKAKTNQSRVHGGPGSGRYPKGSHYDPNITSREDRMPFKDSHNMFTRKPSISDYKSGSYREKMVEFNKDLSEYHASKVVVYHGTSSEALEHIKKEGIVPAKGLGGKAWAQEEGYYDSVSFDNQADRKSVFVTHDVNHAIGYAKMAAEVTHSTPVLLRVEIPESFTWDSIGRDAGDESALTYNAGTIPPEWVSSESWVQPSSFEGNDFYKSLKEGSGFGAIKQHTIEKQNKFYIVLMVDESKSMVHGGPGSGRYPAGSGKTPEQKAQEAKTGKRLGGGYVPTEARRIKMGPPEEVLSRVHGIDDIRELNGLKQSFSEADLPDGKMPDYSSIPTSQEERQGRCFELSTRFVMDNPDWEAVHATLYPRLGNFKDQIYFHGFAQRGNFVYDPVFDTLNNKDRYYKYYSITDVRKYSQDEVLKNSLKTRNYGPWE
jgi:hypothetical protein